jgi:hypothetical protein
VHIAEQGIDALLLDSGDQRLPVKVIGGTDITIKKERPRVEELLAHYRTAIGSDYDG